MHTKAAVTLKTIATQLNVSVTTVARALNNGERISPSMIEKVQAMADRLGYVRNLDGVKLRTGKTFVLMAFLSIPTEEEIGDSGSVGLLNGIHKRLSDSDYAVRTVPVTKSDSGLGMIKKVVNGRNADGIILDHTTPDDERVKYLLTTGIPFVTFGRTNHSSQHAYFDLDNEFAAYQGTKEMIKQGFQRIALLEADLGYTYVSQRVAGYKRALEEAGLNYNVDLIRHMEQEAPLAFTAAAQLLNENVDAFVCVTEQVFMGARAGVHRALGDKAANIGFSLRSGTNICAYLNSSISTCFYSRVDAGWNLADLLLKQIAGAPLSQCQNIAKTALRNFK
ncbi:MAG: LacI family DNA-binding transcriptional regulator [Oceanospirillaceae bacterium]|nr:LacI family DNA-binding transcriptional regulator [Oceanospirillaceae bacterium]